MLIEDFTLVIPTYNRPRMLATALRHYTSQRPDLRIIVVDSSKADLQALNVVTVASCPADIRHVRYPHTMTITEKFNTIPDLIETPFAMTVADDDIALLRGVFASLGFLRDNPEYVACHGTYYNGALAAAETLKVGTEYATLSIDLDTPVARLFALALRYQAITYSVQRRETIRGARPAPHVVSTHFWELFNAFAIAISGKVAALAVPFMVRNAQMGFQEEFLCNGTNWLLHDSAEVGRAYAQFRSGLAPLLAGRGRKRSAEHIIDLIYATFTARTLDFKYIAAVLEAHGEMGSGSAAVLGAVVAVPNVAVAPPDDVPPILREFMIGGWPNFG